MATTIKLKNGSGAPLAGDLVQGEPALDLTNKRLYTENAGGTVIEIGTSPSTIDINAGTIDGTVIGGSSAAAGTFTTFTSTGIDDNATSTAITIDASQNVGIGTTNATPSNGEGMCIGSSSTITRIDMRNSTTGDVTGDGTSLQLNGNNFTIENREAGYVAIATSLTERMRIDSSGNVGIGTTTPNSAGLGANGQTLQLSSRTFIATDASGDTVLGGLSGSNFTAFYQGGTERMRIDVAGRVGIGTSSPTNNLDIGFADLSSGSIGFRSSTYSQIAKIVGSHDSGTAEGSLRFHTRSGGSEPERMRIDASGNVGIGTTSPSGKLNIDTAQAGDSASSSATRTLLLAQTSTTQATAGALKVEGVIHPSVYRINIDSSTGSGAAAPLSFSTSNSATETMRIDSSGNLLVGTSSLGGNSGRFQAVRSNTGAIGYFEINNGGGAQNAVDITNAANAAFVPLRFWVNGYGTGSLVGSISCTTSGTAFNATSDVRVKENIVDAPAGNIDAIRVRSFDWKADGTHQPYGMIAQELVEVAPEAVTQGETEEDMWGVDYSKLVPMMIKEIQDLRARVAQLEGA